MATVRHKVMKESELDTTRKGKIIEEGTHESLLADGGKYGNLYKQYFEHQSLDWQPDHRVPSAKSFEK